MPKTMSSQKILGASMVAMVMGSLALGQQANSATGSLRINNTDPGFGPIPVTADPCSGFRLNISSGPNVNMPFTLTLGPLLVGATGIPSVGVYDLNFTSPAWQVVMDGIFAGSLGGSPFLNNFAYTDLGGQFDFSGAIGFGGGGGPIGAFQALILDPTSAGGFIFTAATDVTVLTAAVGGTYAPPVDGALTHNFAAGFSFPFYGVSYSQVNISENGVLGFGALASLIAMVAPGGAAPVQPITNSTAILGTGGTVAPPNIGMFENLSLGSNGGGGSIVWSESPTTFNITYCNVVILPGAFTSTFTISLHGTASPTPGRIEFTVVNGPVATQGNGRVLGISPGGNGAASLSPTLTGVNLSAVSRDINALAVNQGFTATGANSAIYESFNGAWGIDPINQVLDLVGTMLIFDPTTPLTGAGPYRVIAANEAPFSITSVQPVASPLAGGGALTVRGNGFRNDGTMSLSLGTIGVTPLTYVNSETLTGVVPSSPIVQTVNVSLTLGSLPATASIMNGFSYTLGPVNGTLPLLDEELVTYTFAPSLFGTFNLYGTNWTRVFVQANGHMFFSATAPVVNANNFVSSPASWNAFPAITVAPFFNDVCGDVVGCGLTGMPMVTTVESATSLTFRWVNWAHWPNANQGLNFAVTFDNTFTPASSITFDYSQTVAPNIAFSQPGGQSGIIVGMKGPGTSAAGPVDLQALSGGSLGAFGMPQGPNTNLYHWIRSGLYTGTVAPSQPTNTWIFGTAAAGGAFGARQVNFLSTTPTNDTFVIALQ